MRKAIAVSGILAAMALAFMAVPQIRQAAVTAAQASPYNPFDCSKRWGSNSSACNSDSGGGRDRGGGGGGGGGGRR